MKRVHEGLSEVENALEILVENTVLTKDLAESAVQNYGNRNASGIAVNPDVDMLKVSKRGETYIQESHADDLSIGGQHVNFGKIGKYVVIGRHPNTGNLYEANIITSGSNAPNANINDLGVSAPKGVSRIDLLIIKGGKFFNLGSNEALIEAEDKF